MNFRQSMELKIFATALATLFLFQNCQNAKVSVVSLPQTSDSGDAIQPFDQPFDNESLGNAVNHETFVDPLDTILHEFNEPSPRCYQQSFHQPSDTRISQLDILLVPDTSGSMKPEREQIASEISAFLNQIPSTVDYQVAIMPAHGHRGSHSGKLWKYRNFPYVLQSKVLSPENMSSILKTSFQNLKGDFHSDGGEQGLYSLARAFDPGMRTAMRAHGFLRPGAGLAVIFISDENDICHRYADESQRVPDPQGLELSAFERDCGSITPESVLHKVRSHFRNRPLLINGIVYTNEATVPKKGEKELGHGYLDLIQLSGGIAVDLALPSFHEGLRDIGELTRTRLTLLTEFEMAQSENINPQSLSVTIDGRPVEAVISGTYIQILGDPGQPDSRVTARYCQNATTKATRQKSISLAPNGMPTLQKPYTLPEGAIDENEDGVDDVTGKELF